MYRTTETVGLEITPQTTLDFLRRKANYHMGESYRLTHQARYSEQFPTDAWHVHNAEKLNRRAEGHAEETRRILRKIDRHKLQNPNLTPRQ